MGCLSRKIRKTRKEELLNLVLRVLFAGFRRQFLREFLEKRHFDIHAPEGGVRQIGC